MNINFNNCNNCGKLMILIGLLLIMPLTILPFYPQECIYTGSFCLPSLGSIILGLFICLLGRRDAEIFQWKTLMQRSSLTVLFAWGWGIFMGALPFIISRQLPFIKSLFESVSGWTATGLTVMDVTNVPHVFLFHRSFMEFCGALGFVMMMVMLVQGKQSMNLYNAEGHPDKLMPNLKRTAQLIVLMYNGLLTLGTVAYAICGMNIFESICHAMCSLSTGGFSTKVDSIGEYNSVAIEIITIILMLIGTINFGVLLLIAKGKLRQFTKVSEIRFMCLILLIFIPITAMTLIHQLGMGIGESLRHSSFDVISALSTAGYSSMSYTSWPPLCLGVLILMMLVGGGLGSTSGGIKLTRVYLMFRIAGENIRKRLSPSRNVKTMYFTKAQGKTLIDPELTRDTTGFIFCYLLVFVVGTLLITLTAGCTLVEAMFEFSSSLGTAGLSIGVTSPITNSPTLIIEMFGMILGRLEIFIVLIGAVSGASIIKQFISKIKAHLHFSCCAF